MKSGWKILGKLILIAAFLYITPFADGCYGMLSAPADVMHRFVYHQQTLPQDLSLKKKMNVLAYNSNITLKEEEYEADMTSERSMILPKEASSVDEKKQKKEEEQEKPEKDQDAAEKEVNSSGKKLYIYNTHQEEAYSDGKTVLDAALILASELKKKGHEVVVETNDFAAYRREHGMDYNDAYAASNKFLNDALAAYGGFDLCIDLHRDSVPRASSYITIDGTPYAKAMMVVAGSSKHVKSASRLSATLTDKINAHKHGIMKSVMTRKEAYYNQFVCEGIVLMECGSDHNSFAEVKNTLKIAAQGIDELLKEE